MNYRYSEKISSLQPSAIREILKVTQDPRVISFAAGNPSPETFPAEEMAKIAHDIFAIDAASALQYGISEGYGLLRELTAARMRNKYAVGKETDDTIIVSGGQQGIELTAKTFLNEGDTVVCEDPSFIGALNAFRSYNAHLVGVPMDAEGMDMDRLEEILKGDKRVKLIYVIPTFQNPSGRTMSIRRRKRLLELASRYDVMIIEDNPYFELRYSGEYVPPIKSMDEEGRVIYVGSYSKVLSPGIRIGYVCADRQVISKLTVAKQVSDVHTNLFFAMLVAKYLERYDIDAHIESIRTLYRHKRDLMQHELAVKAAECLSFNQPDGGLFIWCEMPRGDGMDLCRIAGGKKVAAVPGASFSIDESKICPTIRLNFSLPSDEQIVKGVGLLAEAAKTYLG